jgi:putative oxidoreductase
MEPIDWALGILRVAVGVTIIAHGVNHGRNIDGTERWFSRVGFKQARLQALASASIEILAGSALVLGLLTQLAAAAVIGVMTTAAGAIHRFNGYFIFRPGEGWEYVNVLAWASLAIAIAGPGSISLDGVLGVDLSGWPGAAIGMSGFAAGVLLLAMFWRRPEKEKA